MKQFSGFLLAAAMVPSVWASQGGTSTAQFLRIGQGARVEGMGGAFTAVANDAHAMHFNPAGLAQITKRKLSLDHLEFIEDIKTENASFVHPINKLNGSLGAEITYVDMGTIDRLDTVGNPESSETKSNAYAATFAWGQAIGDRLALGAGIKFINQNLAGTKDSGVAGDAGALLFLVPDRLAVGASLQNFGAKMKIGNTDENLPTTVRGGVVMYAIPEQLLFTADVEKERDTDTILHGGAEYTYLRRFVVRLGYRDTLDASGGFSAGAGYIWRPNTDQSADFFGGKDKSVTTDEGMVIQFDYAFVDYGDFDATHRFGVSLSF
jgi:long-subunit fatty acid transport protein